MPQFDCYELVLGLKMKVVTHHFRFLFERYTTSGVIVNRYLLLRASSARTCEDKYPQTTLLETIAARSFAEQYGEAGRLTKVQWICYIN